MSGNSTTQCKISPEAEDWDRSFTLSGHAAHAGSAPLGESVTPQNSVAFPSEGLEIEFAGCRQDVMTKGKRSLSELLRLHAEKGTDCCLSPEEASRIGDMLRQWINASVSPYEGDDDFWARSHDDFSIQRKRSMVALTFDGRPRGQSESSNSRPSTTHNVSKS